MDTSKEYVKMCEKAVEIQELWKPQNDDLYTFGYNHESYIFTERKLTKKEIIAYIWLPRQDQLQKMLYDKYPRWIGLLLFFSDWLADNTSAEDEISTPEQLWLAFVMKEKYNKIWNGEDWGSDG